LGCLVLGGVAANDGAARGCWWQSGLWFWVAEVVGRAGNCCYLVLFELAEWREEEWVSFLECLSVNELEIYLAEFST